MSTKIYTMERKVYATNAPLERHSNQVYLSIKCHSNSVNGPSAPQQGWIDDVVIGDWKLVNHD